MKKYRKEIIIVLIQLLLFYVFPLFAGAVGAIGMVMLIIIATFILSVIIGNISREKVKYFYPIIVSMSFIPSVFIFYNETALIHSVWYLVISFVGTIIGANTN